MERELRLQALLAEMELQRSMLQASVGELRNNLGPGLVARIKPLRLVAGVLHSRSVWLGAASVLLTMWRRSSSHRRQRRRHHQTRSAGLEEQIE